MPRIGVITGTRREAACLRPFSNSYEVDIVCSGADSDAARRGVEALISRGSDALLSFGLAGGVDPDLPSGTLVLATSVMSPDGRQGNVSARWRESVVSEFNEGGQDFMSGPVVGVDLAVTDPEPKRLLHGGTGGLCVDMESHAVMETAAARDIPWLVVRAIADAADDVLPDIAFDAIDKKGGVRVFALAARLLRNPRDLSDLMGLWRLSRPGLAVLGRVAAFPGLGRPF